MTKLEKLKKRKKIYLILIIVIGILLVADIVLFAVVGTGRGRGGFSSDKAPMNFDSENLPEGFDKEKMPQRPGAASDDSNNVDRDDNNASSSDDASGTDSKDTDKSGKKFDKDNMPADFDPSNMPDGFRHGERAAKGNVIRIVSLVAGILLLILEIVSVVLFVITNRKIKAFIGDEENSSDTDDEKKKTKQRELKKPLDSVEARKRKQKRDRILLIFIAILVVAIVVTLSVLSGKKNSTQSVEVEESVQEQTADLGSVNQTVKGSGVVASTDETTISVPGSITVTKYYVAKGDAVAAGDKLAAVDCNSVNAAIGDVEALLSTLDQEMADSKDASISAIVTAPADARVASVYAQTQKDVLDVMYDNGALMVLSLDGRLAIDVPNDGSLTVDTVVQVKTADGENYDGVVNAIEKDKVVVTVSMDDCDAGESVTVISEDGSKTYATGALYVANALDVTGYSGTIASVKVSTGDTVSEGDTLLTLENTDYTAQYQSLLTKRIALVNQYNTLVEIANTGYVFADADGTISDVDESLLASNKTSITASSKRNESVDVSAMSLDSFETYSTNMLAMVSTPANAVKKIATLFGIHTSDKEVETATTEESGTDIETISKTVSVIWLDSNQSVTSENLPKSVTVDLLAGETVVQTATLDEKSGWTYTWSNLPKYDNGVEILYSIRESKVEGYTTTSKVDGSVTIIINAQTAKQTEGSDAQKPSDANQKTEDNQKSDDSQKPDNNQMPDANQKSVKQSNAQKDNQNMSNQNRSNATSVSSDSEKSDVAITTEAEEDYILEETVLGSMMPNDQVNIDVTIDELDINDVAVGQSCEVILDALSGQQFEGKIVRRDSAGENNGGNTKYTVTVAIDKTEDMILGMNASVNIVLEKKENILVIPEDALVEQDGHVYVYTEYDEKKDELSGLAEVETGNSDGTNVEITDGISSGQKIYYRYAGTIQYRF